MKEGGHWAYPGRAAAAVWLSCNAKAFPSQYHDIQVIGVFVTKSIPERVADSKSAPCLQNISVEYDG
jgi:hypothetical protein